MRERVFIICGGPSLKGFDFSKLKNEDTIVVNKSIFDVPSPNYFITVDYTFLQKINISQFKSIKTTKVFVANLGHPSLNEQNGQIVDTRFKLVYHLDVFDIIIKSYKTEGIGYSFNDFRGGLNSGFCALQLATILGYKKIYLLGIDLNTPGNTTHYHEGYGEEKNFFKSKLEIYYNYFASGLNLLTSSERGIRVVSCSPISRLNQLIPFCDWTEILK